MGHLKRKQLPSDSLMPVLSLRPSHFLYFKKLLGPGAYEIKSPEGAALVIHQVKGFNVNPVEGDSFSHYKFILSIELF